MANYQETKPAAVDQFNQSQGDIQQNFEAIKALVDVDHSTFAGGVSPEGKHKQATFILQADDPATLVNEMAIYNKGNALFIQPQNVVAGVDGIDFTSYTVGPPGETVLPSGIKVKWGTGVINTGQVTSGDIVFAAGNAFIGAPYFVQVTPTGLSAGAAQDSVLHAYTATDTKFNVTRNAAYVAGGNVNFTYLAFGV